MQLRLSYRRAATRSRSSCPRFDEERSVALLFEELQAALEPLGRPWEVVFVDDGSTDGSFAALTRLHAANDNVQRRPPAPELRQGGRARRPASRRRAARSSSRSTATSRTILPRSRGCWPSSTRASTSSRAGRRRRRDPLVAAPPLEDLQPVAGRGLGPAAARHELRPQGLPGRGGAAASGSTASCTASSPCSPTTAATASPSSRSTTGRASHGRSRYGVERYLRGFFDLLTVSFVGPLPAPAAAPVRRPRPRCSALARHGDPRLPDRAEDRRRGDRAPAAADPRRAARRRRDAALLARAARRDDHAATTRSAPASASAELPRRGDPAASRAARPLLRDVRADLPAKRPGHLVPARSGRRGESSGTSPSGRAASTSGRRARRRRSGCSPRRGPTAADAAASRDFDALIVGYPGHLDLPAARLAARGKPRRVQPARLARGHARRRPRRASTPARCRHARSPRVDRLALRAADLVVADTEANADDFAHRAGSPHKRVAVCLVGAEERVFQPGWAAARPVQRPVRRQADPAARARDDPRCGAPRSRTSASGSSEAASSTRCSTTRPAERRVGPLDRVRAPAGSAPRRGLRARDLRHLGQGRARDPEQGVPGDRVRNAGRHRRHAGARASCSPTARARCSCRPATRRRSRPRSRRLAEDPALAERIGGRRPRRVPGRRRARTCSAAAGATCSSSRCERPHRRCWCADRAPSPPGSQRSRCSATGVRDGRFDLGNMVQAVWSTAHGHPLADDRPRRRADLAARRALRPILAAFAPLWLLWPEPRLLLVAQAVGVALGALPVFWLARKHLGSRAGRARVRPRVPAVPAVQWLALDDFHAGRARDCPLLLFAFWYLDEDRLVPFAVFAVLAVPDEGGDRPRRRRDGALVRARARTARGRAARSPPPDVAWSLARDRSS